MQEKITLKLRATEAADDAVIKNLIAKTSNKKLKFCNRLSYSQKNLLMLEVKPFG